MRRTRLATSTEAVLPSELRRSAPRPVSFTAAGWATLVAIGLLTAGSIGFSVWLGLKLNAAGVQAQQLRREGVETQAVVLRVRRANGSDAQANVQYRFEDNGREYTGKGRLRKRDPRRRTLKEGGAVTVRYLPSQPSQNWLAGDEPRSLSPLAALGAPAVAFPIAALVLFSMRRQRRLLEEGRATMARVTRVQKIRSDKQTIWRTHFEWQLLSRAIRSGRVDRTGKPPTEGAFLPLLYLRDNPKRYTVYPTSFFRVARW